MYEYATRYNLGGPVVHKRRLPGGEWERYTPDCSHITEAMKVEFRRLTAENHERIRRERLLKMKPATERIQ